jgi:hypothetical protein
MCLKNTSGNPFNRQCGIGDTVLYRLNAQAFHGRLLTVMARLTRFMSVAKCENGWGSGGQHAISAG